MIPLLIISILSVLNVNIVEVSAPVYPVITFAPQYTVNTTANLPIGKVFNWLISTDYSGSDIWGYEFTITYNPVVLNVLNVSNGDLIVNTIGDSGANFINGSIDNTSGKLSVTSAFFYYDEALSPPVNVTTGDGTLAIVKFKVTGVGDSDMTFGPETRLIGWNTTADEEYNIVDDTMAGHTLNGYFANTNPIHNVRVNSVTPNDTSVLSGELVKITVNVENTGNVTERFDVTAYYSSLPVETQTITLGVTSQNLYFIWDTTSERGNFTISAEASDVGSTLDAETNAADNTKEAPIADNVIVIPPTLAVMNSTGGNEIIDTTHSGGETFSVTINITNAYNLDTVMFNLTWRDLILRTVYIVKGDFFEGVTHAFSVTNDTNYALISYNSTGGGVSGSGSIANITFKVQSRGGSLIELKPYPVWWTTYWVTTPVLVNGIYSNYYDMGFQPGSYIDRGWVYPRWFNVIPQKIIAFPRNNGFLYLSYNLSLYANGTLFATANQTLVGKQHSPGNFRTYTFEWNYTGVGWGKVYITANITQVEPEDNKPENNYENFAGGYVTVRITGDTDENGAVDFDDFITFAGDYGFKAGETGYDLVSEMDADGDVDFDDFIIFAGRYGYSTDNYP